MSSFSESADDYAHVVVRLNERWRVISCRDGMQWIVQKHKGTQWHSDSFCRTREGLVRCAKTAGLLNPGAMEALQDLPEWHQAVEGPTLRQMARQTGRVADL